MYKRVQSQLRYTIIADLETISAHKNKAGRLLKCEFIFHVQYVLGNGPSLPFLIEMNPIIETNPLSLLLQFIITQGCNGRAKKGEDLRYAKTDFTNGKGEDSTLKAQLADDGEELSRPNHAKSNMVKAGQRLYEDNTTPLPAAMYGLDVEIIEDDDGPLLPPAMSAVPFDGDSPDLDAVRTAAS